MKFATLQLLLFGLLLGCSTPRVSITKPIAKYDTTELRRSVADTNKSVQKLSEHVTTATVRTSVAAEKAAQIEAEGAAAHSEAAKQMVLSLAQVSDELIHTREEILVAQMNVSTALTEASATAENLKTVHLQLEDTAQKFDIQQKQLDKSHDDAMRYKDYAKKEAILIAVLFLIGGIYGFLKFYLHVPFL